MAASSFFALSWKVEVVMKIPRLPLREELRGIEPYGAPQLDVPLVAAQLVLGFCG